MTYSWLEVNMTLRNSLTVSENRNGHLKYKDPAHLRLRGAFLKRHFASVGSGPMTVRMDQKYVKKLADLLDLHANKGKLTPTTGTFQKRLQGQPLSREESRLCKTCVGVLLYMSTKRPDIQCAVRQLASKVTGPDALDKKELKERSLHGQRLGRRQNFKEIYVTQPHVPQRQFLLECISKPKAHMIALSSCQGELISADSAVSGMADGIYIKRMLEAVLNMKVVLELRIDSSSARALLRR